MTHPRTDGNQAEIVKALVKAGARVAITTGVKRGFPDLAVGWNGRSILVEVKVGNEKLTDDELDFMQTWKGEYHVVRSAEEALRIIGR